jgi:type IV pilus assembly protein PilM
MAENQSTIALNIGTQRVNLALFETSKSGALVLSQFDSESILADPAMDAARPIQIRNAIEALVSRLGSKGKARYAVSGQSVFTRFVKLPPLDDDNIEQLVTFEAQQHIPFQLEEVVWDYEILEAGGEKEVVIIAIKSDVLDEINESVNAAGLATAEVDVAPMALYNAFRAAYADVTEPVLLIDIGAKTSDLLYIEGERFFTRSANVGGASVTTAIAKEFDVPFEEAENHKTQNGMVALGSGHTEQLDESTAALATCIRNAMTRLATEIPRTTNYFRSQHGGNAPKRVYLAGGGANLPYAKEFFEEKLKLPVEYFNPLPAISVGKKVDTERLSKEAHTMSELIGLGLRGIGKSKINIDLVPAKVGEARAAEKRKPWLVCAALVVILGAGLFGWFKTQAADRAEERAREIGGQVDSLRGPASAIDALVDKEENMKRIARGYTRADRQRVFWIDLYQELNQAFASEFVWLTDFEPLALYDPTAEEPEGKPAVKRDFLSSTGGQSSIEDIKRAQPTETRPRGRRRGAPQEPADAPVNAVRIKGFWLKNPSNQNVVYDLLGNLRENAEEGGSHFSFRVGEGDDARELEEREIVPVLDSAPAADEFAAPFEMVLPLAEPVPYQ